MEVSQLESTDKRVNTALVVQSQLPSNSVETGTPCVDCIVPLGAPDALLPSHLCVRSLDASRSRGPLGAGPCFLTPFCSCSAASSAPSESDRVQAEHDARPAFLALDFLARFARQCRTCAASCTGALFTTLLSQYDFNAATCSGASPLVAARLRKNATHTCTRAVLERLRALLQACS